MTAGCRRARADLGVIGAVLSSDAVEKKVLQAADAPYQASDLASARSDRKV